MSQPESGPVDTPQSPDELVTALVEAQRRIEPDREVFAAFGGFRGTTVQHPGFGGDGEIQLRSDQDLKDLEKDSLIRVLSRDDLGDILTFDVTTEGARHALAIGAREEGESRGKLEWSTDVLPVLQAVYAAYPQRAPGAGVSPNQVNAQLGRAPDDWVTDLVLHELVQTGYLRATLNSDRHFAPDFSELTEKALRLLASWPAPDAGSAALLAAIKVQIEEADSEEERSRWQRAYEAIRDVGERVFVEVASKAIMREM